MTRAITLSVLASALLLGAVGCKHKCRSGCLDREPRPYLPPGPSVIGGPVPAGSTIPPPGVPTAPPSGLVPGVGPSGSNRPAPEVLLPDPLPGGPSSRSGSPGVLGNPVNPTAEPPIGRPATAGLPGFTRVKDGLAAGGKPALDGFDSLKHAGYRTVVYLHAPGADVAKAKDVVESRGMKLVAVETTPEKLAEAFEQFNRTVGDTVGRPAYVYSDEAVRAGAVWYLYFRTVEQQSPEVAKIRAGGLGLSEEGDDAKAFWVAIQQYLASR